MLAGAAAIFLWVPPAAAQGMDYGSLEQLFGEPVTTSATGTPQRASEVSANMTIITADEIRQSGSRSIPEILGMYVPGLNVLQEGIDAFDIGVRGYQQPYQPRLLVLVDGRQVFNDDYSRMSWDNMAVNVDDIRQIEVVKGASSALFGSNATGGVINIITYSASNDHDTVASAGIGSQRQVHADGTATFGLGDGGGLKISAGILGAKEFSTPRTAGDSTVGAVNPTHRYVSASSQFSLGGDLSAQMEATYADKDNQEAVFIDAIDPVRSTSYSLRGGLLWDSPYGLIKSDTYLNHNNTELDAGQRGTIEVANQLIVSQLEDLFKVGNDSTFRAFVEYRNKRQSDQGFPFLVFERPQFSSNVVTAGGTWLWAISDAWSLTNAIRVDHTTMNLGGTIEKAAIHPESAYAKPYDTVAANSGLVYKLPDGDTIRATYGRGVSDPSLVNSSFYLGIVTGKTSLLDYEGNPDLKPTVVENQSLDYEHVIPDLLSTLKLSVYHESNADLAAFVTGKPRVVGGLVYVLKTTQNVGGSTGVGGEIELDGAIDGFRWNGSYSYQSVHDAPLAATLLDYDNSAPAHQLRANVGYTQGAWETDLHAQFATSTDMLRFTKSIVPVFAGASYNIGARIGYNLTDNIVIALSGSHLTRSVTQESAYPAVERQYLLSVTSRF